MRQDAGMSQQSRFEAVATVPGLTAEVFLEAWARGPHGRWTLVRHTAEKL